MISLFAWLATFLILLLLFGFVFDIRRNIAIQKIHDQKSWVWYAWWAVMTSWFWAPIFLIGISGFDAGLYGLSVLSLVVLAGIFWLWYRFIPRANIADLSVMRFAAGSVRKQGDELDFSAPAESVATRLMNLQDYVSVIGIFGPPGSGKSSFARMIIESLPREEILYTYISLTETNEAKDFSALFAERWLKSLSEKYPKIDTSLALPFMRSILRESGNGFVTSLFELAPFLSKGLLPTKAHAFDRALPPPRQRADTSDEVASVFGNVPEITEKLWVVMIDEIERARFDEIYRVTEIIERFKNEGRTGVPVRVMFVLCVSDAELRKYLQECSDDPLSHLLHGFFFERSKSLTIAPIYLPPISYEKRVQYFREKLLAFNGSLDESQREKRLAENLHNAYFDSISRIDSFEPDEGKRLSRLLGLMGFLPRLIARCIDGLYFTFGIYRKEFVARPKIRLSDLLIMEYIKIEYPEIMQFFTDRVDALRSLFDNRGAMTAVGIQAYFEKRGFGDDKKKRVADLVEEITGEKISDDKKSRVEDLIAFASWWAYSYWNTDYETSANEKVGYIGTLSDPHELWVYLRMVDSGEESPYAKLNSLHARHQKDQLDFKTLSQENLHDYERFLIDIGNAPVEMHLDIVKEIARRLTKGEIEIQPSNVGDTVFDTFIFDFEYTLLTIIEYARSIAGKSDDDTKQASQIMGDVLALFEEIMKSEHVTTGGKFIILNSYTNDRGRGSGINRRFTDAFDYMLQHDRKRIEGLVGYVFDEYKRKYFTGKKSIYDNEENFFYVMYQGWSGKSTNNTEIKAIRKVAARNLEKHPIAIELYWDRYTIRGPAQPRNYKDVSRSVFEDMNSNALYMPLATLVAKSKEATGLSDTALGNMRFWQDAAKDSEYVQARETLKDTEETLRSAVTRKGLLPAE